MISKSEKKKILAVPLCGHKVIERLESIGIRMLSDLCGQDPFGLLKRINIAAGHVIWRAPMAVAALSNLIKAAEEKNRK